MADDMNDHELDQLLGAYALDALDGDERAAVEAYLAISPRAHDEVEGFREVAGWLVQPTEQPPELWSGIQNALEPAPVASLTAKRVPAGDARLVAVAQHRRRRRGVPDHRDSARHR